MTEYEVLRKTFDRLSQNKKECDLEIYDSIKNTRLDIIFKNKDNAILRFRFNKKGECYTAYTI